jgi:hypothetical protein
MLAARRVAHRSTHARTPSPCASARLTKKTAALAGGGGGIDAAAPAAPAATPLPPNTLRVHWLVAGDPERARGYGLHVWGDVKAPTEWSSPLQPAACGAAVGGAVFDVPLGPGAPTWVGALVHRPPARQGAPHEEAVGIERLDVSGGLREVWLVGEAGGAVAVAAAGAPAAATAAPPAFFSTSPPDMRGVAPGSLARARAHWATRDTILWRVPATEGGLRAGARRRFFLHASAGARLALGAAAGVQGADDGATFELLPPAEADPLRFSPATARYPHLYGCTELRLPPEAIARAPELLRCQLAVSVVAGGGGGGGAGGGGDGGPAPPPPAPPAPLLDATAVQTAGALDDFFATDAPLGDWADPGSGARTFSVWAPTAQRVELLVWADGPDYALDPRTGAPRSPADARRAARRLPPSVVLDLSRGPGGTPEAGVWSAPRPREWTGKAYKLRVTAFCPWTGAVERCEATEPYARALTADGERCVFVDLGAPGMAPGGWDGHASPPLAQWTDVSVYELHVRDFSATDPTVPAALRGKYLAFSPRSLEAAARAGADEGAAAAAALAALAAPCSSSSSSSSSSPDPPPPRLSAGLAHLAALADAGLTHVHLLPTFDFGSVPERPENQLVADRRELQGHPPDSERPQAAVTRVAARDAFNWGYDPVHWGVPEGGYSVDADGPARTPELREAVRALHALGLRVVLDVVYNHTFASGPESDQSVLDKIVPGERGRKTRGTMTTTRGRGAPRSLFRRPFPARHSGRTRVAASARRA